MTAADLEAAVEGMTAGGSARWLPFVTAAAERFDFSAPLRMTMWVAQVAEESGGFKRLRESLNYRAVALRKNWPRRFPTDADAERFAHKSEAIANKVYGSRLGNGPEESGDGWRFRGRGLIQITGRANYRSCGKALGVDLEQHPELLETEQLAALSAGWYWKVRALGPLADRGDIVEVTRLINGSTVDLADRRARYDRALAVLHPALAA